MGLFNKKKKGAKTQSVHESEAADAIDGEDDGAANKKNKKKSKKGGAIGRIKKKFRITITRKRPKSNDEDASELDDGEEKKKKGKKARPKKEKKPKPKKEKKPRRKKNKNSGDEDGEGSRKIKPILLIAIIGGGLLAGGIAFGVVTFMNRPTVEEQLMEAQLLLNNQEYVKADKAYRKIIKKDETLAQAYVGLAGALVGQEQTDAAIQELTDALIPTSNHPDVQAKLDSLTPPVPEAELGPSSAPIAFADAAFEKLLRLAMNKPSGDISEEDLSGITVLKFLGDTHAGIIDADKGINNMANVNSFNKSDGYEIGGVFYTERGTIKSLADIAHFKNLSKLTIGYNSINNISGLDSLPDLHTVGLYANDISDISPLSKVSELKFLYIYDNKISDISPISSLANLEQLWLNNNNITDISPVKGLSLLEELFIDNNQVTDITPIAKLNNLYFFSARMNNISDISVVKDLPSLTDVSFLDNPVTDMSPAAHILNVNRSFG